MIFFEPFQQAFNTLHRQGLNQYCRMVRDQFERSMTKPQRPHGLIISEQNANGVKAELLSWRQDAPRRYVVYLHGGGYVLGSIETHRELAAQIALRANARVLIIDYHLAPEGPYPSGLNDAEAAYRWLLDIGVPPSQIAIAGDSAGGGLTLALLQRLKASNSPLPAAAVYLSPWVDLTCSSPSLDTNTATDMILNKAQMQSFARVYAGQKPLDHPGVSPLFGELEGMPPSLIQVSRQELLLNDATRLADRLEKAGVITHLSKWSQMPHVWQMLHRYLLQSDEALKEIGEFLQQRVAGDE
ncbi:Acetyl esterase/lipase [Oceanospirillum multiglobuliferum]|nr:alpha/beta hydrolase [Oceanospirillum multiglobuliferum]SJZ73377.1 Acetyl esterase/lipase [Oceanospirillum multiglobuliferum]